MKLKNYIDFMSNKYKEFITETVYIGKIGLKNYSIVSIRPGVGKSDFGHAIVKMTFFDDNDISLLMETYGILKDKEIIVKVQGSSLKVDEDMFRNSIEKLVYILNKNQLGEYFKIDSIKFDKDLDPYAILKTDGFVAIDKLEQILTTTKIINPKVKKENELDKMIYKTHES